MNSYKDMFLNWIQRKKKENWTGQRSHITPTLWSLQGLFSGSVLILWFVFMFVFIRMIWFYCTNLPTCCTKNKNSNLQQEFTWKQHHCRDFFIFRKNKLQVRLLKWRWFKYFSFRWGILKNTKKWDGGIFRRTVLRKKLQAKGVIFVMHHQDSF